MSAAANAPRADGPAAWGPTADGPAAAGAGAGRPTEVRIELLRPSEIRAALDDNSTVYLPLGTIEWHCNHLPVGLDGLTAHGVCVRSALDHGGLVYPALYFGTGGGHAGYPWTVMVDGEQIRALLQAALHRLADFGVRRAVVFSGHFADKQLELIAEVATWWDTLLADTADWLAGQASGTQLSADV